MKGQNSRLFPKFDWFLEFGRILETTPARMGGLCTAQDSRSGFSKVLIQPAELAPRNLVEAGGAGRSAAAEILQKRIPLLSTNLTLSN